MNQYLSTGIKEVMQRFPEVGAILGQYGIGCVTCNAGTCLLKDVVQIHRLPKSQEAVLMAKIEQAIYPGREVPIPDLSLHTGGNEEAEPLKPQYSPPIKKLVEEHKNIKRLLHFIPEICDEISQNKLDYKIVNDCIYYIRNYADKFHHAKEEEILFAYAGGEQDIIQVMYREHQTGRNCVKTIAEGLAADNGPQIIEGLTGYYNLLQEHIRKEDEILYPWIDRNLSTRQVGELASRFKEVDQKFSTNIINSFQKFLQTLATKFNMNPARSFINS